MSTRQRPLNGSRTYRIPRGKVRGSILLVENTPTLGKKIASVLAGAGFEVMDVPGFHEALLKMECSKPDLVILDEELPVVDGWEACSRVHQTIDIPIILLGNEHDDWAWWKAVEAGADCYLAKPFSRLELVARVKAILRRYKGEWNIA